MLFSQQHVIDSLRVELLANNNDRYKMQTHIELAKIYGRTDIQQSYDYAIKAADLAEKYGALEISVQSSILIAEYHWKKTEYSLALEYATKAKEMSIELGFDNHLAKSVLIIGSIYTEIGDYKNDFNLLFQALKIFERLDDKKGKSHALISIAASFFEQNNPDKALEYALKSLMLSKGINDLNGTARALNNIGAIYGELKDNKKQELYYLESARIAKELNWDLGLAIIYLNLGEVNFKMSNIDTSFAFYEKAFEILKVVGNNKFIAQYHILKAKNFLYIKDYDEGIFEAQKALQIGIENNNMNKIIHSASSVLHKLYEKNNNIHQAYKFALLQSKMNDSINIDATIMKLSQLEIKYQYENKLQEIKNKQQLREYNYKMITVISASILIIIIILLIFRQKIKSKNTALVRKQLELDLDHKNRELATNAMSILKSNETLTDISKTILQIKKQAEKSETKSALQKIATKIKRSSKNNNWEEFELRFKQVHSSFYNNLLKQYPSLTPNEMRLCALLKLNLTTKEISELTGQRVPSIEIARSRLRKKLEITNRNTSLIVFLAQF